MMEGKQRDGAGPGGRGRARQAAPPAQAYRTAPGRAARTLQPSPTEPCAPQTNQLTKQYTVQKGCSGVGLRGGCARGAAQGERRGRRSRCWAAASGQRHGPLQAALTGPPHPGLQQRQPRRAAQAGRRSGACRRVAAARGQRQGRLQAHRAPAPRAATAAAAAPGGAAGAGTGTATLNRSCMRGGSPSAGGSASHRHPRWAHRCLNSRRGMLTSRPRNHSEKLPGRRCRSRVARSQSRWMAARTAATVSAHTSAAQKGRPARERRARSHHTACKKDARRCVQQTPPCLHSSSSLLPAPARPSPQFRE